MGHCDVNGNSFKILSLNCWGLWYISKHRKQRINFIAQYLTEKDYDFVFLQEIWCESDYQYIRSTTASKFKFAHLFKTASILGNSGLVVLAKWKPSYIHFEPFVINGTPFRPWHGDWFSGKGVAYVRIEHNGTNLHLFGCHMHAQYALDEQLDAQYSIHRICQAYQLAKFINLIGHSFVGSSSRDLLILAGDLNTDSNELPYRLLVSMTNLTDSYGQYVNHGVCDLNDGSNSKISAKYFIEDAELITCGHRSNTFTGSDESGKRIDYIMYKLIQQQCDEDSTTGETVDHFYCMSDRVECHGKDVDAGLSFSDHQPVAIQLKLKSKSLESELKCSVDSMSSTENGVEMKTNNSKSECGIGDGSSLLLESSSVESDEIASPLCERVNTCDRPFNSSAEFVSTDNSTIRRRIKPNSNISVETSSFNGHNCVKDDNNIPPELKKQAIAAVSKLYPLSKSKMMDKLDSSRNENLYLRRAHQLIESYISTNMKLKKRSMIIYSMVIILLVVAATLAGSYVNASTTQMCLAWSSIAVGGLFFFVIMEIIYRFEQNAITGVFEDMEYMLDFVDYH